MMCAAAPAGRTGIIFSGAKETFLRKLALILMSLSLPATAIAQTPEVLGTGFVTPWGLAPTPDGRIFVTERPGRIQVVDSDGRWPRPVIDLRNVVSEIGEGGLMGIAVDPNFMANNYFYVMYTYRVSAGVYANRVERLVDEWSTARRDRIIVDGIPGGEAHDGGRIKIGPDNKLYIGTGTMRCEVAQYLGALDGKILRVNLDGSAPADNPFPGQAPLVYSYGHRDVQGLAWNAQGQLFATEHGPTGDCGYEYSRDEINLIVRGGNYGWPVCAGSCSPYDSRYIDPIREWTPIAEGGEGTAAPCGAAFHPNGWFFFATLGSSAFAPAPLWSRHLHAILFDNTATPIDEQTLFYEQFGRIRDVVADPIPGRYVYFTTSNRDGRGDVIQAGDDKVIRVAF